MNDDPFIHVVTIVNAMNTPVAKIVKRYTRDDVSDMSLLIRNVHRAIFCHKIHLDVIFIRILIPR